MSETALKDRRPVGQSRIAAEFRLLPGHAVAPLKVDPVLILVVDMIVTACVLLVDDDDVRPWHERLGDLEYLIEGVVDDPAVLDDFVQRMERFADPNNGDLQRWIAKAKSQGGQRFVARLLGTARYTRLANALKADAAPVLIAVRRGLRWALPFTVAVDDCAHLLPPGQVADIFRACDPRGNGKTRVSISVLELLLQLDGHLDRAVELGVPLPQATTRVDERQSLDVGDMQQLARELRQVIERQSRGLVGEMSQALANKIQGARDALDHSADPVSQAANSLIELIDRLLRQAFPAEVVMEWARENLPDDLATTLVYQHGDELRPTKYGQALCFAYAGRRIEQRSPFNEIAAAGLIAARTQLQKLKHADAGTEAEKEQMLGLLSAVEAYLVLAIRMSWSLGSDADLERLRSKFGTAA